MQNRLHTSHYYCITSKLVLFLVKKDRHALFYCTIAFLCHAQLTTRGGRATYPTQRGEYQLHGGGFLLTARRRFPTYCTAELSYLSVNNFLFFCLGVYY